MPAVNFWTNHFRTGTYDLYMPRNYDLALRDGFTMLDPKPGSKLLDAGCGNGRILHHMQRWIKAGGQVTGFDIDEAGIARCRSRAKELGLNGNLRYKTGDMLAMDELDLAQFDAAIAHFSIYTLPTDEARRKALINIARHIVSGGRILVGVPNDKYDAAAIVRDAIELEGKQMGKLSPTYWYRRLILYPKILKSLTGIQEQLEAGQFHRYTLEELTQHLVSAGFTDIQVRETYGGSGYHALATKA